MEVYHDAGYMTDSPLVAFDILRDMLVQPEPPRDENVRDCVDYLVSAGAVEPEEAKRLTGADLRLAQRTVDEEENRFVVRAAEDYWKRHPKTRNR